MRADEGFTVQRFDRTFTVEGLLALVQDAFRDLPIDPPSSVLAETAADFTRRLESEEALVAVAGGRLVGGVFCAPREEGLYVGRLAVRADQRHRGVAGALLDAAKVEARRIGAARVLLSARIALPGNVALFERHGFVVVGERCHPGFETPTFYDMELRL